MRVLFVYSLRDGLIANRPLDSFVDIHIGLSYLSAYLKARHHETRLVVLSSETESRSLALLEQAAREFDPQLVAFTAVATQYPFISAAALHLKQAQPGRFLIAGGVHASLNPTAVIHDAFDAVCIGEGELPMAELCEQLEAGQPPRGIRNLWIKGADGAVEKNPTRDFLAALEQLPFPDREMWQEWVMAKRATQQVVLPSRGCPYVCTYCSNHALRKLADGKYVRHRPPEDIVEEVRFLKQRYPKTNQIYLQSETIAINLNWLQALTAQLQAFNESLDEKISFICNFRVEGRFLTEAVFTALQRANVQAVEIGLESGSERIRCEVLRRNYSNGDFFRAVELARRFGMRVNIYNMIGLPGETLADYWETVAVNRRICPDESITSIFHPYPGTDLFETCKAEGLLSATGQLTAERRRAMVDYPGFSRKEIQRAFEWFDYRVYRGRRPFHYRLRRVLRNKAFSRAWSHQVFMRLLPLWYAVRGRRL